MQLEVPTNERTPDITAPGEGQCGTAMAAQRQQCDDELSEGTFY